MSAPTSLLAVNIFIRIHASQFLVLVFVCQVIVYSTGYWTFDVSSFSLTYSISRSTRPTPEYRFKLKWKVYCDVSYAQRLKTLSHFLDPEGGSPNATLVVLILVFVVVVVITSRKILKAFFICSGAQRNFAYTFTLTFPTDLLSQILKLMSN